MNTTMQFFPKGGKWLASSRYRVFLLAEALERLGHLCLIHDPPRTLRRYLAHRLGHQPSLVELGRIRLQETLRNARALRRAGPHDIIFAQRSVYSRSFAAMLMKMRGARRLVFDIDDAVYEGQAGLTQRFMREADLVVAGSHAIADYAREAGARAVHLFPTSVPLERYPVRVSRDPAAPLTLGWMGTGPEHIENLKLLRAPMMELARRTEFLFLFVGTLNGREILDLLHSFEGVKMEIVPDLDWADAGTVARMLHRFDVGLMPLTDTTRHRAKCAFKAIESMACGIPVVVSRVGENTHLLEEGGGCLAQTPADWIRELSRLLEDAAYRDLLGARARQVVEARYDLEQNAARFSDRIRELFDLQAP